ncbi:hypothetical protein [Stratiformator vulcanicus]|uniref:Uncharacterized protein n=1 Tax=Stratiformator vulcanicus TaxID=2527980 RepID=A0A517R3H5_9PLAN|nr:hypothetical protein [Stratiformator vulcanicus]QDT38431.1 hypothetical protein Pan189_28250 [Stratiformator vulcanicus]
MDAHHGGVTSPDGNNLDSSKAELPASFLELAASRRQWIDETLAPWCRSASRTELVKAEAEWTNLAGRVDPRGTLWKWAWGRFPALVEEQLGEIDETHEVRVTRCDGSYVTGYPDARRSEHGRLAIISTAEDDADPISIDEIASVERALSPHV